MKNLRLLSFAAGSLLASAGFIVVACGGDGTVVTRPLDSGTDGTIDRPDGTTPQADGGADADRPDTGLTPFNFSERIAESMCSALARCCFGNANLPEDAGVDGGHFERAECLDLYGRLGFENSNYGEFVNDAGNVEFDRAKADDCFLKIEQLACELTGSALKTIRAACFEAVKGKLGAGQPCRADMECQTGHFCLSEGGVPGPEAGVIGECTALRAADQSCDIYPNAGDDTAATFSESACSNRGGGTPALRCDSWDGVGDDYRPRDEWLCKAAVANGQPCNSTVWCADGICDPDDFTCKSPLAYFSRYSCEAHVR